MQSGFFRLGGGGVRRCLRNRIPLAGVSGAGAVRIAPVLPPELCAQILSPPEIVGGGPWHGKSSR